MKNTIKAFICMLTFLYSASNATSQARETIRIPDIPGYITLTYDPHMHTVFSDGTVWPTVRVNEAWQEGLDIISITDHIEYRPFRSDVTSDHNRAFEIAQPVANRMGIMLIHGAEITRPMPPGHFNALFIEDANLLETDLWQDAIGAARNQGAFILWNHPAWDRQQPDTTLWWDEHTWLLENDMLHGISVINGSTYCPESHRWCIEKNIAIIGTTDVHHPIQMAYDIANGQRRPMTLVFVREHTEESVKEALFSGRTAAYFDNILYGREEHLKAILDQSLVAESVERFANRFAVKLYNPTDIPLELVKVHGNNPGFEFFRNHTVPAGGYSNFNVYVEDARSYEEIELKLAVNNFMESPGKGIALSLVLKP